MNEPYLTMAEIEARYANQWVLIASPTRRRRSLAPTGGHVVVHAADRTEFYRLWREWKDETTRSSAVRCRSFAVEYVGKFPEEEDEILPAEPEVAHQ